MAESNDSELLGRIKARFDCAREADAEWRAQAISDLAFLNPETQWDRDARLEREGLGLPVLTDDVISGMCKQVCNDFRMSTPSLQFQPLKNTTREIAEIHQGIFRHIENKSNAKLAYEIALESVVRCGKGFLKVETDWESEESFDQEMYIKAVANPFSIYYDPAHKEVDGSDIDWAMELVDYTQDSFEQNWPDADVPTTEFFVGGAGDTMPDLDLEDNERVVRVVEYYEKIRTRVKLHQLNDGSIVKEEAGVKVPKHLIERTRSVEQTTIKAVIATSQEIISETIFPGDIIPIIPVFGETLTMDGKRLYKGLITNGKDSQKRINFLVSNLVEQISLQSKVSWVGPRGFMGNQEKAWRDSNRVPYVALEFEVIDDSEGKPLPPPTRSSPATDTSTLVNALSMAHESIKSNLQLFDPSMGRNKSDQSGVAIQKLQQMGGVSSYHFSANLSRAIRIVGKIYLKIRGIIYDTPRTIRIIGEDDKEQMTAINDGSFDMSQGDYDVVVNTGPSYTTKRQENLAVFMDLLMKVPGIANVAPDLIISQMDFPGSEELRKRLEKTLPPGLVEAKEGEPEQNPQVLQMQQQMMDLQQQLAMANDKRSLEIMKLELEERKSAAELQVKLAVEAMKVGMPQWGQQEYEQLEQIPMQQQEQQAQQQQMQQAQQQPPEQQAPQEGQEQPGPDSPSPDMGSMLAGLM